MEHIPSNPSSGWLFYSAMNVIGSAIMLCVLWYFTKQTDQAPALREAEYSSIFMGAGFGIMILGLLMHVHFGGSGTNLLKPQLFGTGALGAGFVILFIALPLVYATALSPIRIAPVFVSHMSTVVALVAWGILSALFPEMFKQLQSGNLRPIIGGIVICLGIFFGLSTEKELETILAFVKKIPAYLMGLFP